MLLDLWILNARKNKIRENFEMVDKKLHRLERKTANEYIMYHENWVLNDIVR